MGSRILTCARALSSMMGCVRSRGRCRRYPACPLKTSVISASNDGLLRRWETSSTNYRKRNGTIIATRSRRLTRLPTCSGLMLKRQSFADLKEWIDGLSNRQVLGNPNAICEATGEPYQEVFVAMFARPGDEKIIEGKVAD